MPFQAAEYHVVAFDADPTVAGIAWRRANKEQANISVLTTNLASPTPALGWNNNEWRSLLDRFAGYFDVVIGLAVMHHLMVTAGIPLADLFERLAMTTKKLVIWEYISPSDPNFQMIVRGREELYEWLNPQSFEEQVTTYFDIKQKVEVIPGNRILYLFVYYQFL